MTAPALLAALADLGIETRAEGDALALKPASRVPPDLLAEARRLKPEIMALLLAERAANDALPSPRIDDSEGGKCPLSAPAAPADDPAEIERLALALMAEAERNPAVTITDREKAALYYRGEAMRRLDLLRQRAIDATTGPDIEREAIQAEERAPMANPEAHAEIVLGLMRAASPLAGVPGARPCCSCGRGIWASPTCPGPHPPDLCTECRRFPPALERIDP